MVAAVPYEVVEELTFCASRSLTIYLTARFDKTQQTNNTKLVIRRQTNITKLVMRIRRVAGEGTSWLHRRLRYTRPTRIAANDVS